MSFHTTSLAKVQDHIIPMFQYLGGNGGHEINAEKIREYCADTEKRWNTINFPFKTTSNEVVKYINLRNKSDAEDRNYIISDHDYSNSELYIFLRYCNMIFSLDSYGRCETIEGSERAFARGRDALRTGILISHIKKLKPWSEYNEEFGGWKEYIDWWSSSQFGTRFTEQKIYSDTKRLEIGESWNKEIKRAFEQDSS